MSGLLSFFTLLQAMLHNFHRYIGFSTVSNCCLIDFNIVPSNNILPFMTFKVNEDDVNGEIKEELKRPDSQLDKRVQVGLS